MADKALRVAIALSVMMGWLTVGSTYSQGPQWDQYSDPYWAFQVSYPADWTLQNLPYRDFGFRISSPDLEVDPLGRPLQGAYLSVLVAPMTTEKWANYRSSVYSNGQLSSTEQADISGVLGEQVSGVNEDGNPFVDRILYSNQHLYHFSFVLADETNPAYVQAGYRMLSGIVLSGLPIPYPPPSAPALRASTQAFSFPAIKHAFQSGSGRIISGYEASGHTGGDNYAFDICEGYQCSEGQEGQYVVAPTDIKLIWSGRGYGMPQGSKDFHIFEIASDGTNRLCMSLAHFEISLPGFGPGKQATRGTVLGSLVDYVPSFPHIHMGLWTVPTANNCAGNARAAVPFTGAYELDGVEYPTGTNWSDTDVTSTNSSTGVTCPTSGGVILYKNANYDCGGEGDSSGYVQRTSTGSQNVPGSFNDQASSIRVPSGWTVKLYEDRNQGGGWACRSDDDDTFWGDRFENDVPLNDQVSSFEVFDSADPAECDHRPNKPSLEQPQVTHDGRAPTLCWNNTGDPDGDQLEFYAEVYDSPVNANSDWMHGTCWRPEQLDGHYHDYQWRVKARDVPHHNESDWSDTGHFAIEPPDYPPSISFSTANGTSVDHNGQVFESNNPNWSFSGTASDDHGVSRVDYHSEGSNGNLTENTAETTSWSYTKNGLYGHNRVYFFAYDNHSPEQRNLGSDRHYIDLYVDDAAPATGHELSGTQGRDGWFISPVQVHLLGRDNGSGNGNDQWAAGVQTLYYQVDGGAWQQYAGSSTSVTVDGDFTHTVRYYARDRVGNQEATQNTATFRIDATLPSAPGAASETHGVVSGVWQKEHNDPVFTWVPAADATSGVGFYHIHWWSDTFTITREITYTPSIVRTGTYTLSVQAEDNAGNVGPAGAFFTFRYDGTPPHAPEIQNNDGVASGVWQKTVRTADFFWPVPADEGSGIAGYNVYWGSNISGTSDALVTATTFVSGIPICAADDAAIYYLRVRSQDNVGWQSEWVAYALAYDGAPPTATLTANYDLTVTHQVNVRLGIAASDKGSGVTQMRFSNDARTWSEWMDIAEETYWQIPDVGRRYHQIYLQVADAAGNVSSVVSDTVYLEVNRSRPKSENYWLWDEAMVAGGAVVASTNYCLRTSMGQSLDAPRVTSANYTLFSGFQAGALAAPTQTVTATTTYYQMGYVVAGGGAPTPTLQSTSYRMYGTLGQPALMLTVTSTHYTLQSGFWGGPGTDLEPPQPPEPPEPSPPPECPSFSILINDGAPFTEQTGVTLDLCGPDPVEVMLSNDEGFTGAAWQPYTQTLSWTLAITGPSVQSRFVYARFRDNVGETYGTFFDDIIYDPNPPEGKAVFDPADLLLPEGEHLLQAGAQPAQIVNERNTDIFVSALDDSSGLAEMQISLTPDFEGAAWQPFSFIAPITFTEDGDHTVYVRVRDASGNILETSSRSVTVDTIPPIGAASVLEGVVGPRTFSVTMALAAVDETTSVSEVRVGALASLTDTLWQPYVWEVATPISYTGEVRPALYVQFCDEAGNESEVYTATYLVDTAPPVMYVEVASGDTLTRSVTILAYDEFTDLGQMWLSNDPSMIDGVVSMPYTPTVTWTFDERRVVWVQLDDSVGNVSDPYPAYCALAQADFAAAPTSGVAPLTVVFTNTSGSYTDSLWDFGGGVTSTVESPIHIYGAAGVYTVTLTVSGPNGSDTLTRTDFITAYAPAQAGFAAAPLAGRPPLTVVFTDTSTDSISAWQWDFGDGGISAAQHPTHTYTLTGTFTVTLTVSGPGGSDAEVKTDYIQVSEEPVIANFTAYPTSGAAPLTVQFADASAGAITSWLWDFGDAIASSQPGPSHTYTIPGVYDVALTVSGPDGTDTLTRTGYVVVSEPLPMAGFTASPTSGPRPLTVTFTDTSTGIISSWAWAFGDGGISTQQCPTHTFTLAGIYTISLSVSGPGGSDTLTRTRYITVSEPPPVAGFIASPTSGLRPLTVVFTDTSTGAISAWQWAFGDGGSSAQQHPTYTYTLAGVYSVSLSAIGPGGSDTLTRTRYITVSETPPMAGFIADPTSGLRPLTVAFTDTSTGMISTWLWTFGDGSSSTQQHPTHLYTLAGVYTVGLKVSGPGGIDTLTRTNYIIVSESPPTPVSVFKSVTPQTRVNYGDELTYTLVVSATPGAQVRLYDPLTQTTFLRFAGSAAGISYASGAITGTLTVAPTNQVTVSFVVEVSIPNMAGITVTVANRACVYPTNGTIEGDCTWSNTVTNAAFRPYGIHLPLVLRSFH